MRGLKDHTEGMLWWTKALKQNPENQRLNTRAGEALFNTGDMQGAQFHFEKSMQSGFDPYALLGLSRIHRIQGNLQDAEACCRKVLETSPEHPRAVEELEKINVARNSQA